MDKEFRDNACNAISGWFLNAVIRFHAASYDSFKEIFELVG